MSQPVPEPPGRLVLLTSSSRVPAGLLTAEAWDLVRAAVVRAPSDHPQVSALRAAGVEVQVVATPDAAGLVAEASGAAKPDEVLVWLVAPDGDPEFTAALAAEIGRRHEAGEPVPVVDTVAAAFDPPGARLLDLVAVMDRLRSPGGCPWDAEQTHASLATYLLEETYETLEAIETGDAVHLREELGDLLLQVVFHARIAQEHAVPWTIDDVAAGIVDKLVRRHPHVFAGADAADAEHVANRWETLKRAEKQRTSALEGIPQAQPALALAAKIVHRAQQSGLEVPVPDVGLPDVLDADEVGDVALALVMAAGRLGVDAEQALRGAIRRLADQLRAAESAAAPG